jgi:hypothetical protein
MEPSGSHGQLCGAASPAVARAALREAGVDLAADGMRRTDATDRWPVGDWTPCSAGYPPLRRSAGR